jgi:hypothetical protein
MYLQELTKAAGIDNVNGNILVRHQEQRYDIEMLYREGMLEFYQAVQGRAIFDNCKYVMAFIGTEATKAVNIGTYEVLL